MSSIVVHHRGEVDETLQGGFLGALAAESSELPLSFSPVAQDFDGPADCSLFIDLLTVSGTYDELSPLLHALAAVARRSTIPSAIRFNSRAAEGKQWCRVTQVAWEHYEVY